MFKSLSLNKKISFVLGMLAFAAIAITCLGTFNMSKINGTVLSITTSDVPRMQIAYRVRGDFRKIALLQANLIMEDSHESILEIQKSLTELDASLRQEMDAAAAGAADDARDEWAGIKEKYAAWWEKALVGQKLALANDDKAAFGVFKEQKVIRGEAEKLLDDVVKIGEADLKNAVEHSQSAYESARLLMAFFSLAAIVASCLLAYFVMRSVNTAIQAVIASLHEGSLQVSSAAQQIAASSQELSQSSTEQAASLEETAASIEEMSSMVQKNSENAKATAQTTGASQQSAAEGKQAVERMVQSMDAINQSNNVIMGQIEHSNSQIGEIVKVIEEIGNKTKVINDIVFQTKLLSFNASVEAARAGEHGKGFAVVAEEVGNLAAMSGRSAKEITDLLESSTQKVESIVQETKSKVGTLVAEGKVKVEEGTQVAKQCGEILEEIVKSVSSVSLMSSEIATASQEQSRGVNEISKAMSQLDQTTQANTAASEQCASAAEQLSAQSQALKTTVGVLVATINGDQATDENQVAPAKSKVRPANVVQLKPKPAQAAHAELALKKAVGDVPRADHKGFEEV